MSAHTRNPAGNSSGGDKVALTVRLDAELYRLVQKESARTGASLGAVVADAALRSLAPQYSAEREAALRAAVDRCLGKLRKLERRSADDGRVLKEMVGLAVRLYLNHTPEVPDDAKGAAVLSGGARFERYLDVLAEHLRRGRTALAYGLPDEDGGGETHDERADDPPEAPDAGPPPGEPEPEDDDHGEPTDHPTLFGRTDGPAPDRPR